MNAQARRALARRMIAGDVPLVGARHGAAAASAISRRPCTVYFRSPVPRDVRSLCVVCIAEVEQEVEEIGARGSSVREVS